MIWNCSGGRPLVKMSAFCSVVWMCLATTPLLSPMCERKKWYLRDRYLLRVDILGTLTIDKQPWLSSNTVDLTRDLVTNLSFSLSANSCRRALIGRSSLIAIENATYSAAVELRVILDWSLLDQIIGQPNKVKAKPVLDFEGLPVPLQQGDNDASSLLQALVVCLKLAWRLARF